MFKFFKPKIKLDGKKPSRIRRFTWLELRHHPVVLPAATFVVLCLLALGVYAWINHSRPNVEPLGTYVVIVSHDHEKQTVPSEAQTVGSLLNKLHIAVNEGDVVEPDRSTLITEDNFRINIYRAQPVEIIDGNQRTFTFSAASTPRSIAEQAGFTVFPADIIISQPVTDFVGTNSISRQLIITQATPVNINFYGTPAVVRTQAKTIGDLLNEKGIKLSVGDNVKPSLDTPIKANMQIFLTHHGVKIESLKRAIAMPVRNIPDKNLTLGTSAVRQIGSPGSEILTYKDTLKNGKVVGRTLIQKIVTQQPVTQIVAVGTGSLGGSLQLWLYKLRQCESSGNYSDNTGNGYYGAYQFSLSTWDSLNTGYARPDLAPPYVQDKAIIENTNRSSGLSTQNPGCYNSTGISNYPPG